MAKGFMTYLVVAILIGLAIFLFVGKIAADVFQIGTRTTSSFNTLIETMKNIKNNGNQESVAFIFDNDKNALLGFAPNAPRLEWIIVSNTNEDVVRYTPRPDAALCPKDKSCLCVCGEITLGQKDLSCTGKLTCQSLDTVQIADYTYISKIPGGAVAKNYYWKNGFAVIRSSEFPQGYIDLGVAMKDNLKGVYVAKEAGKISVCGKSDCRVGSPFSP